MKIEFDTKLFSELNGGDAFIVTPKRNPEDIFVKFNIPLETDTTRVNSISLYDGHTEYFYDCTVVYPIQCMIIK